MATNRATPLAATAAVFFLTLAPLLIAEAKLDCACAAERQ